ncbi:Hypothetical protein FRAAL6666 [Frankia alni ACN14a]|uniref:Uncharacterized protein n=1 Tax=Frankia alni (strain DSM 45986 / CECT 9034 / ACN14a) TaxID=326424 RepID=Q0RB97_FRAAA|nr:Hypothetical protein FRAAL6666 [Frankia alni ACN14a]
MCVRYRSDDPPPTCVAGTRHRAWMPPDVSMQAEVTAGDWMEAADNRDRAAWTNPGRRRPGPRLPAYPEG